MATKKIESLTEIKEAVAATSAVAETKRKPSRDKQGRSYATGKRKNAVAINRFLLILCLILYSIIKMSPHDSLCYNA